MRTAGKWLLGTAMMALAAVAYLMWGFDLAEELPEGFAKSNGRIEATEIDLATKTRNRILEVLADEGDFVSAGQVGARMDPHVLSAELREAQAQSRVAKSSVEAARTTVTQRERQKAAADSDVAQHEAHLNSRNRHFDCVNNLAAKGRCHGG